MFIGKLIVGVRPAVVATFLSLSASLLGCAATSASSSNDTMRADADRPLAPRADAADDRVLAGPVLEREAYVRAVLARNPSIESARQGWRAALARVREAGAFEDPMVDVGVAPLSIGSSSARFGWEATVSQKLPWFGKRGLAAAVETAEAEASKSDLEATRRELTLSASMLYDQYFVAARSIEINQQHVELMRTLRAAATAQFESGRGSAQDPLQAEGELAHMEHDAVVLASQRDIAVAQMNELLHRDPELPLPPPPKELRLAPMPDVKDARRLAGDAVERRPEIVAARKHAEAERARVDKAARDYYPDVTVSTTYNSMWDMPEHRWMVGLGLNLPIQTAWRGGAEDEANAARARFESEAVRMSDKARTEVVVALKRLEEARHVLAVYEERVLPIAREQIDAARAAFTSSQTPFVSVIGAERNLRNVELEVQVTRAAYGDRYAELERALGRGVSP